MDAYSRGQPAPGRRAAIILARSRRESKFRALNFKILPG
jgi:hypothetical protein